MFVLEDLCTGKLKSRNIIIEDVTEAPGRLLVLVLLHHMCQRYDEVLLVASERPPHFFINALPAALRHKVRVPNLPKPKRIVDKLPVGPLITATHNAIQGSGVSVGMVIDSVSTIVFKHSSTAVPQLVRSLLDYKERGNKVEQMVSLIHTGVHDESTCRIIRGHPDTLIQMHRPSSPRHHYACHIHHGDAWQQPGQHTEEFNISADCIHVQDVISRSSTKTARVDVAQPQMDPTANLTFNLSLKPEEKAAKDQVVLPYTQNQLSSSENQKGVVHYVPDNDDFDDEDPDEDLDF